MKGHRPEGAGGEYKDSSTSLAGWTRRAPYNPPMTDKTKEITKHPVTKTPTPVKRERGQFVAGVSGNPNGRPLGARNKITVLRDSLELQLRERAAPNITSVLDKAITLAQAGDRAMIKLLLELHMAKSGPEREHAVDKVQINISSANGHKADIRQDNVIDVTPEKVG